MVYFGPPWITWSKLVNTHPPIWLPVFIQSNSPGATVGGGIPIRRSSVEIISSYSCIVTVLMSSHKKNHRVYRRPTDLRLAFAKYYSNKYSTGWAKKVGYYIWRLTPSVYIFKVPEPISVIFGALQHRFILNTSIYSMFLKFIIQNGATWRKLTTRTSL